MLIAMLGSVFSPWYARARRQGAADPLAHCALNVGLYGTGGKRWALTERRGAAVARGPSWLRIGPSALHWGADGLTVRIDEVTVPLPARVRGTVRLHVPAVETRSFALDAAGRHRWSPIAPCAWAEVTFTRPALRWAGPAYLDTNAGDAPLEADFVRWDWSRARLRDGTAVFYDVTPRLGAPVSHAVRYRAAGGVTTFAPPPLAPLPPGHWRVPRATRADSTFPARIRETLEDTPFYTRSVLTARLFGEPVTALHESLSLDRFRSRWVQALLPFRMARSRR